MTVAAQDDSIDTAIRHHKEPIMHTTTLRLAVFIGTMSIAFEAHAGRGGAMLMKDLTRLFSHLFQQYVGG